MAVSLARIVLLGAALLSLEALAQAPASRTVVFLLPAGEATDEGASPLAALRSQLADLAVKLRGEPAPADGDRQLMLETRAEELVQDPDVLAALWIEPQRPDRLVVLTRQGSSRHRFVRSIAVQSRSVRDETLALIARASIQALLERPPATGEDTAAPLTPPAAAPVPVATAPTVAEAIDRDSGRKWIGVEAAYAYGAHSAESPAVHGAHLGLAVYLTPAWRVFADYQVQAALSARNDEVRVEIQHHPVSLGAAYRWLLDRLSLGLGLALTLDYQTRSTNVLSPLVETAGKQGQLAVLARPRVDGRLRIYDWLSVFLELGAEIRVRGVRYVSEGPPGEEILVESWPVRPRALLGLVLDVW